MGDELWKPVPDFEEYAVSSAGRVRRAAGGRGARAGHVLSPRVNNCGYRLVTLFRCDRGKSCLVSRLVCAAFHGPPPTDLHEAAHLDGDPQNNRANNLRWATRVENCADKIEHGTLIKGAAVVTSKLTEKDVLAIRADRRTQVAIAEAYRVSQALVSSIKRRGVWTHL